jgi:hypothetical protein
MTWLSARAPFTEDEVRKYASACEAIWTHNNAKYPAWGWKDPRTCILYRDLWSGFTRSAKFIVVYRDPAQVLESLLLRKITRRWKYRYLPDSLYSLYFHLTRRDYDNAHLVCWNYYNQCLLHLLKTKAPEDYLVVAGDTLRSHAQLMYQTVTNQWGIPLQGRMISDFIKPVKSTRLPDLSKLDPVTLRETNAVLKALTSLSDHSRHTHSQDT